MSDLSGHRGDPASIHETEAGSSDPPTAPFQAFTEDTRIVGRVRVEGRLSDALNRRTPLPVFAVRTGPIGGEELGDAPDVHELDPYELVVVAAGPDSQPPASAERHAAMRLRKTRYDVCCVLDDGQVCGTVHVYPGTEPTELAGYRPELFVPVTGADVRVRGASPDDAALDVAFVNHIYLRSVVPLDEAAEPGPAAGASGTDEGAWDS
jgi:hypothetical protein